LAAKARRRKGRTGGHFLVLPLFFAPARPGRKLSAVFGVGPTRRRDLLLEALAHLEQLLLGDDVIAATLEMELVETGLDDRVDRARLLAETAVDALEQIDLVARGAAGAVGARCRVDGDRRGRTHGFAQLAGDAALLAVGIAAQRVQPAEARARRGALVGVVHGDLGRHEVAQRHHQ